jgi:hypothetical protein
MDVLTLERKMDDGEVAQFRDASLWERVFLCWKQFFDVKKYCFLALVLSLILTIQLVQLVQLLPLADFEAVKNSTKFLGDTYNKYFGGNDTDLSASLDREFGGG